MKNDRPLFVSIIHCPLRSDHNKSVQYRISSSHLIHRLSPRLLPDIAPCGLPCIRPINLRVRMDTHELSERDWAAKMPEEN